MTSGEQVQRGQSPSSGSLRAALLATIWIVAFVVGFFLIPYHDVFAGDRYGPPDLFKPLIYGVLATTAIGGGLTYLFSDQLKH